MTTMSLAARLAVIASLPVLAFGALGAMATPALAQESPPRAVAQPADNQTLFVILYRAGPNWTPGVPMSEQGLLEHFYYIRDLDRAGRIVLAGPVGEDGGMIVLRAADQAEADGVIVADPAVTAGKFVGTAAPFVARFNGSAG
jgi:uncharacterized protein YciI